MKRILGFLFFICFSVASFGQATQYDPTTARKGYVPALPNDATKFLDGTGVFSSSVTANNGLTATGNNVQLGGTLIQNTTIQGNSKQLLIDTISVFTVRAVNLGINSVSKILLGAGAGIMQIGSLANDTTAFVEAIRASGDYQVFMQAQKGSASAFNYPQILLKAADSSVNIQAPHIIFHSGSSPTAVSIITLAQDAAVPRSEADILVNESGGGEAGRIRFISDIAGDAGDILIGRLAGSTLSNTSSRVFIGWRAGELATSTSSTFIGYEAGRIATGTRNTFIGVQAGKNITTGNNNILIGHNSALNADLIINNTMVGVNTGPQIWSGRQSDNNTFIGAGAGLAFSSSAFTATKNTFVGSQVVNNIAGGYVDNNTFVGYGICVGSPSGTIGSNNNFFGANIVSSGASNTTIIGQGITCNLSNVVVIGRADQNVHIGYTTLSTDQGSPVVLNGRVAYSTRTTAINTTLAATDRTLFLTAGGLTITLPAASGCPGAVYAVINQSTSSTFGTNYINFSGASVNTIAANAAIWIQSDGTNWQRIM